MSSQEVHLLRQQVSALRGGSNGGGGVAARAAPSTSSTSSGGAVDGAFKVAVIGPTQAGKTKIAAQVGEHGTLCNRTCHPLHCLHSSSVVDLTRVVWDAVEGAWVGDRLRA